MNSLPTTLLLINLDFLFSQTQMFAQTTREIPEWVTVLKYFANVKCGSFLFVSWFMGFGIGLIFTFLFWHLQVGTGHVGVEMFPFLSITI